MSLNELAQSSSDTQPVNMCCNPPPHIAEQATQTTDASENNTYDKRLATFKRWPKVLYHLASELCSAGFYYTNIGDQVECYACKGQIIDWELNDSPWDEHARFYPHCAHVINVKGSSFIKNAIIRNEWN